MNRISFVGKGALRIAEPREAAEAGGRLSPLKSKVALWISYIMILFGVFPATIWAGEHTTQTTASMVLQVEEPDSVAPKILQRIEKSGGYFLRWERTEINARVPVDSLDAIMAFLKKQGVVLDPNLNTQDRAAEILRLKNEVAGSRELLAKMQQVAKEGDPEKMVQVEWRIANLVSEIESAEGQLRAAIAYCQDVSLYIRFTFLERQLPPPDGSSPFPWVSGLHLPLHRGEFQ